MYCETHLHETMAISLNALHSLGRTQKTILCHASSASVRVISEQPSHAEGRHQYVLQAKTDVQ